MADPIHPIPPGPLCCQNCGAEIVLPETQPWLREAKKGMPGRRPSATPKPAPRTRRTYAKKFCQGCNRAFMPTGPNGRFCAHCKSQRARS